MSFDRSIPRPGSGRITLALLAVVPAVMAYPWHSRRDYWLIGIAAFVVIVLFAWWRGLYLTTILHRRVAMMRRRPAERGAEADTSTTVTLRIGPPASDIDVLPLPVIARYLNCYGIRVDAIRITGRTTGSGETQTWIGLTVSAATNLAALQARAARIPLHETARVTARRLADHLREIGWEVSLVSAEDLPSLLDPDSDHALRETWRGVQHGDSEYLAAYRVIVDAALPDTLAEIWSHPALETWMAIEIAARGRSGADYSVAAACAFRTDEQPAVAAPLATLIPQRGNHGPTLAAMELSSTRALDGYADAPENLLMRLVWSTPGAGLHRAAPTETASRT